MLSLLECIYYVAYALYPTTLLTRGGTVRNLGGCDTNEGMSGMKKGMDSGGQEGKKRGFGFFGAGAGVGITASVLLSL